MDRNLVTVIFCLLIAGSMNTFAQRHYKNISALEMNYGSNIFGDYGHYGNLSFSKYVNRKSYWKAGISYFEKPYDMPSLNRRFLLRLRPHLLQLHLHGMHRQLRKRLYR